LLCDMNSSSRRDEYLVHRLQCFNNTNWIGSKIFSKISFFDFFSRQYSTRKLYYYGLFH
jgi:hypothetical protein